MFMNKHLGDKRTDELDAKAVVEAEIKRFTDKCSLNGQLKCKFEILQYIPSEMKSVPIGYASDLSCLPKYFPIKEITSNADYLVMLTFTSKLYLIRQTNITLFE